jgi:putative flavoprotein involved in K+ transport
MPPTETSADVVIVGAGAAGLSAGGALRKKGVAAVLLDKDDRVGGTWERRYDRLHLHTVRRFSGLAHYPLPRDYPKYVPKDVFASYLRDYADHFGLNVQLNQEVREVRPDDGLWRVETASGTWRARVVIVATGHYNEPLVPRWPGEDEFRGRILHSVDYRSGRMFAGQRALVIGIGNSGAEIATDLVEQGAAYVAIAVRTPPPIMPRDLFGVVPAQVFGIAFMPVPAPRLLDRVGAVTRRLGVGDLTKYGLGKAAWGPFTARRPAVIDVGFLRELKRGQIHVRPDVAGFSSDAVVFSDGREEPFDLVIAATGFDTALRRLLVGSDVVDAEGQLRFRSGRQTPYAGLYFIGFDETIRGHLLEANRESKRLAATAVRYLAGPVRP